MAASMFQLDLQCFRLHAVKVHIIYTDFVWRQAHDAAFRDHEILPGIGNQAVRSEATLEWVEATKGLTFLTVYLTGTIRA